MQKGKPNAPARNHAPPADDSPAGLRPLVGLACLLDESAPSGKSLDSGQAPQHNPRPGDRNLMRALSSP